MEQDTLVALFTFLFPSVIDYSFSFSYQMSLMLSKLHVKDYRQ